MESLRLGKHTHAICVCTEQQHGQRDDLGMKVRHEKLHPISLCFGTCQKGAQPPCQAPAATARARPVVDPILKMTASTSFTNVSRTPTSTDVTHVDSEQNNAQFFCHSATDSQLSARRYTPTILRRNFSDHRERGVTNGRHRPSGGRPSPGEAGAADGQAGRMLCVKERSQFVVAVPSSLNMSAPR